MKTFTKQPAEVRDVDIRFGAYFDALGGDTISSVEVEVTSGNTGGAGDLVFGPGALPSTVLTADIDTGTAEQTVKVWIGAGTTAITYVVTMTMTSVAGRVREVDFRVRVKEL
jgi:hypothetical protein